MQDNSLLTAFRVAFQYIYLHQKAGMNKCGKKLLLLLAGLIFTVAQVNAGGADSLRTVLPDTSGSLQDSLLSGSNNVGIYSEDTTKFRSVLNGMADSLKGDLKTPTRSKALSFRSVAIPVGMIGLGTLTAFSTDLQKINLFARREIYEDRSNWKYVKVDNYLMFAPAVTVYALNMAGIKGKNNFVDRSVMYVMSNAIANGVVFSTKKLANVIRPDSSDRHSFPSAHTAGAFVSAEFLRQEYKDVSPWIGAAGYASAIATGVLRMYNNKHWLNDVVVGAGVGVLSVRLSYWLYPKLKNTILQQTGGRTKTVVMPTYQNGAFGVGMITNF